MTRRLLCLTLATILGAATLCLSTQGPAMAACGTSVNWMHASEACEQSGGDDVGTTGGRSEHQVFSYPACAVKVGALCGRNLTCTTAGGKPGTSYNVTIDGVAQGQRCVPDDAPDAPPGITPALVLRTMRELDWPVPTFTVQPPDGVTLVNLPTNVFTTATTPLTRRVRLLDAAVTIEATPRRYRWSFADGRPVEGTDPGAPYPALRVTHTYARTGAYAVALSTTFSGRYRVGDGPWLALPDTLTLDSPAQPLRVVEATPRLVGP